MNAAAAWLAGVSDEPATVPVFVAYPLGYDWMWMYWYFMRFADAGSPFGPSRCMDAGPMTSRPRRGDRRPPVRLPADPPVQLNSGHRPGPSHS